MAHDTIDFVPNRLNLAPVVFRGMTGREVGLVAGSGLIVGIPLGVVGMFVFHAFAMVPTVMAVFAGGFVWFGGSLLRRLRRGRPETWLYRRVQWSLAHYGFNGADLLVASATYRPGRRRRAPPKSRRGQP